MCKNDLEKKLSFVYSKDLANQILFLLKNSDSIEKYKSYNLCFDEKPTYKELVDLMVLQW